MSKTFENLITLTQILNGEPGAPGAPGKDGNVFFIKTTQEEIIKVKISEPATGSSGFSFSPETLSFSLTKPQGDNPEELISFKNSFELGYYIGESYISLLDIGESFLTFKEVEYSDDGNESQTETESLYFHIQDYVDYLDETSSAFKHWTEGDIVVKFAYLQDGKEVAVKLLSCRHGINNDLAKFNVNAFNINAAVKDSYLQFDQKGLVISGRGENSGLRIKNLSGETVLYADAKGNLRFTGHLEGATGSFRGALYATEAEFEKGNIGGFSISKNTLTSKATIIDTETNEQVPAIELDGTTGKIFAHNLTLGDGATIKNKIQLGRAILYNPLENSNKLIESGQLIIKDDGTAQFGDISVDGNNSTISGQNWSIQNNYATFSNVNVSGSIESAVFKTNSVQAAGGSMIFRPSYNFDSEVLPAVQTDVILKEEPPDLLNHIVWVIGTSGKYYSAEIIAHDTGSRQVTLVFEKDTVFGNDERLKLIIDLGLMLENEAIIGINSGNAPIGGGLIQPCGLTINSLNNTSLPHLFLGNLSSLGSNYSGHGLYADNVYLNGSLITTSTSNLIAGVNTITGRVGDIEVVGSSSPIIFWAGAKTLDDIPNAPFQVTEDGYMYAAQAKLTGSLIAESSIYGADIYAARLHGKDGALSIYDTSRGIIFKKESDDSATFSIATDGFKIADRNFIKIDSNEKVSFAGESFSTGALNITKEGSIPVIKHSEGTSSCGFYFETNITKFKMGSKQVASFTADGMSTNGTFVLQGDGVHLEYKGVAEGYDLYVIEE